MHCRVFHTIPPLPTRCQQQLAATFPCPQLGTRSLDAESSSGTGCCPQMSTEPNGGTVTRTNNPFPRGRSPPKRRPGESVPRQPCDTDKRVFCTFSKYQLSTYYVPGTSDPGDAAMDKNDQDPALRLFTRVQEPSKQAIALIQTVINHLLSV